jgi:hypothetical protein
MLIIFTIMMMYIFSMGFGKSLLIAYVLQGLLIMIAAQKAYNAVVKYGLGV